MPQSTRRWITQKVDELRNAPQLPFHDLLDPATVNQVLDKNQVSFRDRIFSPLVTLWTFLSQVLSRDHSCREAVARLIAFRVSNGQEPCGPETGSYCKARQRLPLKGITDLVQGTAPRLQKQAPDSWRWKGREVALVDGSTVSMPDTAANQEVFPQPSSQKPGVGFPLARLVAIISLSTGALRLWPWVRTPARRPARPRCSARSGIISRRGKSSWVIGISPRFAGSRLWSSAASTDCFGCTRSESTTSVGAGCWG